MIRSNFRSLLVASFFLGALFIVPATSFGQFQCPTESQQGIASATAQGVYSIPLYPSSGISVEDFKEWMDEEAKRKLQTKLAQLDIYYRFFCGASVIVVGEIKISRHANVPHTPPNYEPPIYGSTASVEVMVVVGE